ncbi:hypothetical protein QG37_07420 [Candidozyma auris]|uniref:Uncharacterized protein n=1 Tax=Candidozyma auris TaxID=498019 RepID=A0A0L0NQ52_CANAR|nr:hypothetical protein QG37_07420 [[Candida] auris]
MASIPACVGIIMSISTMPYVHGSLIKPTDPDVLEENDIKIKKGSLMIQSIALVVVHFIYIIATIVYAFSLHRKQKNGNRTTDEPT